MKHWDPVLREPYLDRGYLTRSEAYQHKLKSCRYDRHIFRGHLWEEISGSPDRLSPRKIGSYSGFQHNLPIDGPYEFRLITC
jgi:hypothetical protein